MRSPERAVTASTGRAATLETAGVLLAIARRRAELIDQLRPWVTRVVDELDPDHRRDTRPCWWQDMPEWSRLDALDRARKAFDDLLTLEVQAQVVLGQMTAAAVDPWRARDVLVGMGRRRAVVLAGLGRTERCLRLRLSPGTAAGLRAAVRGLVREEEDAARAREWVAAQRPLGAAS